MTQRAAAVPTRPAISGMAARQMPTGAALSAALMLALAIPAFWPDYLAKLRAVDPYTHAHALLGLLWLLALIVQPLHIRARKVPLHRLVGRVAGIIGVGFVVSSVLLTHHRASRMDAATFERDGFGFYLPLSMAAFFCAALVMGLIWRRVTPMHARFMVCTSLSLVDPLLARLLYFYGPPLPAPLLYQVPAFTVITAVLVVLLRTLPPSSPGRGSFRVFSLAVIGVLLLYFATPYSGTWLRFLQWFRALPLT